MKQAGVSVVVPVYNNASTLPELARRIRAVLSDRAIDLVMVDDASTDGSSETIRRLGGRAIRHARNRGQNAAILSGLAEATQPMCCVLDADLEDPPEAIPAMLARMDVAGVQVVFSGREEARPVSSRLFRWAIHCLFPSLPPHPCLCFAIDEAGRMALLAAARDDDYLPAVIGALGLPSTQIDVARTLRPTGGGPSMYGRLRRVCYGAAMLAASLRVWWRLPADGQKRA